MSTGPVEWVAIVFDGAGIDPAVVPALAEIVGSGTACANGTVARTAVVAGTASAVAGGVAERQQEGTHPRREALAAPAPPAPGDVIAQLTRLGEMRAAGVLTEGEFATQKARVPGT